MSLVLVPYDLYDDLIRECLFLMTSLIFVSRTYACVFFSWYCYLKLFCSLNACFYDDLHIFHLLCYDVVLLRCYLIDCFYDDLHIFSFVSYDFTGFVSCDVTGFVSCDVTGFVSCDVTGFCSRTFLPSRLPHTACSCPGTENIKKNFLNENKLFKIE